MIEDAHSIPDGTVLECDLCIIGGGPAGITIAHELRNSGKSIILLESGGEKETQPAMDLNKGYAASPSSHEPLEENRRRVWGGATSAWGGRCIPFDSVDFEKRDWVSHSGWPFPKTELDPYYARAMQLCEAGKYECSVEEAFPGRQSEMIAGFDDAEVVSNRLERWGPPTHFGKRYAADLRAAKTVRVFLHANCLGLRMDESGAHILSVDAASEPGKAFSIRPKRCVLACGTLENTRLLLASNDVAKAGIGNQSGALGRYYMSHLFGAVASVKVHDTGNSFFYEFERDKEGVYCRRRFWITPKAQHEHRIMNAVGFFFRPPAGISQHDSGLASATHLAKFLLGTFRRNNPLRALGILRGNRKELATHLRRVLADAPTLAPEVASIIRHRFFAKRRLPIVLPPRRSNPYHLFYQTEHAPNPESRVYLHTERDRFGIPRLEVDVRFGDIDKHTVLEMHRIIQMRFATTGAGEFKCDETALLDWIEERRRHFNSSAHQFGTTRMSTDSTSGVVDPQCRVHGVENLWVTGASIFPTSGHANPTLTIVALAVRLADHLRLS